MPKEKGEEIKAPTEDKTPEVEEAPTAEQQLETLQTQLKETATRAEKAERSEQGLRGSLQEKDTQLKRQAGSDSRFEALNERIEFLATAIALGKSEEGMTGVSDETLQNVKSELKRMRESEEAKRKETQEQTQMEEFYQKGSTIYSEAEEVYGDDVDALHNIRNLIRAGDHDLAEKKVAKAKGKPTDTKGDKMESEEDLKQRWIEEGKRLAKEESGELKTDNNSPSGAGGSLTIAQLEKMSPEEKRVRRDEIAKLPLIEEQKTKQEAKYGLA